MIHSLALIVALCGSNAAQVLPAVTPSEEQHAAVSAARLPVLADQLRARQVDEAELRALLETSLGSGVSIQSLVGALEVVVQELEAGGSMPDLALRLPGLIGQGLEGDDLASMLSAGAQSAAASVLAAPAPPAADAVEAPPSDEVSAN